MADIADSGTGLARKTLDKMKLFVGRDCIAMCSVFNLDFLTLGTYWNGQNCLGFAGGVNAQGLEGAVSRRLLYVRDPGCWWHGLEI